MPAAAARRGVEFLALYILTPVVLYFVLPPRGILPVLWVAGLTAWLGMRRGEAADAGDAERGAVRARCRREIPRILLRFVIAAAVLTAALRAYRPEWLFYFPRRYTGPWAMVMVLYPLVSVFPQGLLYRRLFERRYAPLFSSPRASWLIGALVFGFAHIVFGNLWAVAFPFLGGLVFLRTYRRTGSLALSGLEHGLYGDLLFTVGWGVYLYHGGTQALLLA